MGVQFIKPDLAIYFAAMPAAISIWIQADYNKANTREDLFGLVHSWLDVVENTGNEVKKKYYQMASRNLYSILTNKSYESKVA